MGTFSPLHLVILALVLLLVFGGRGKLSGIMGDAAKGIRAFRDGLKDDLSGAVSEPQPRLLTADRDNHSAPAE
jgi:sec-independent protein translocase protein TatA